MGERGCVSTHGLAVAPEPPRHPSTHDAVRGRRAADETLHLAAVPAHGVLHGLARDDGGSCGRRGGLYRNPAGIAPHRHHNLRPGCSGGSVHVPGVGDTLTVDKEGDLALTHADAGDDGFADVLPCVGLGDGFQVQLVAVAQDLDANTAGASGTGYSTPLGTAPQLGHPAIPCWTPFWSR